MDALLPDAGKKAHAEMHKVLNDAQARYAEDIKKARQSVLTVEGKTVQTEVQTQKMTFDDFVEAADYAVIEDAYKRAGRAISPDLATTYAEHLASQTDDTEDVEEALTEAHTTIAAIGLVPAIKNDLEAAAERLAKDWLRKFHDEIKTLKDERQEVYRQISEMSTDPFPIDIARPHMWLQPTTAREPNGREFDLPRYERHFLCDEDGKFPNNPGSTWEPVVLNAELQRKGNIGWYRNPDRASQDSLGVIYEDAGESWVVRPDFIFFVRMDDGSVAADLVDPHGVHFADALPKLKGLARYAEANGGSFRRIEAVAKTDKGFRVLDLKNADVRLLIGKADNARVLFEGAAAKDYAV